MRLRAHVGFAVVLALLLTGCTGDTEPTEPAATTTGPTPTAAADPPPGPPEGRCYQLGFAAALAPTMPAAKARRCNRKHSAETYLVGRLDLIVEGHQVAVDSTRARDQVASKCPAALPKFLGADRAAVRLSMVQPVWFTPSLEEANLGAEWFRCDAVVLAGDRELVRLSESLRGALGDDRADRFAMCGTAAPDSPDFERVVCSADHSWRAVSVVEFEARKYPGPAAARARGQSPCETTGADHADDPLDYQWGYEWPTKEQWRDDMTYGRCWVPVEG